jgi:RimJ/RimL family protein N-acetyltransferase
MGAVSIHREPDSRAELGYWLGVPYWNQGYMSEAVRRMIQYGFEHMQLNRVFARYLMTNPASGRVMQKAGMTYEGVMRKHTRKGDQFHDLAYYSILRSEFYAG